MEGYGFGNHNVRLDRIVVEDDESWGIFTGPEFGCIHHKAKA
jgi:hypothetical protein